MDKEEKGELDKAVASFLTALLVGLLHLIIGRDEWYYAFGVMWIYAALVHVLRFRYIENMNIDFG